MLKFNEIKDLLYSCVRCGTCKYTNKSYLPSCPAGERYGFESYYASGKQFIGRGIIEGRLDFNDPLLIEKLYSCPTCGNCIIQCPLGHGQYLVEIYEALRAESVKRGYGPLPSQLEFLKSLKNYENPYLKPRKEKERWQKKMEPPPPKARKGMTEVLYFVGCTAALMHELRTIPQATATILREAGVNFGILGSDESCCGSTALRIGDRDTFLRLAEKNIKVINDLGVATVVTSCAGCYRTLSSDYPSAGELKPAVLHTAQFLDELLKEDRLKFSKRYDRIVTYHDPCHLGRLGDVYDAPRNVLKAIPGITFMEMERSGENAWCCGAGGGVRAAFPQWALETALIRLEEAKKTAATHLVSTCPFCYQNFSGSINAHGLDIKMVDLVEILAGVISTAKTGVMSGHWTE